MDADISFTLPETGNIHWTGRLVKRWEHNGEKFFAIRKGDFITISHLRYGHLFSYGNIGYDYCISKEGIPALARKLNCWND